MANEFKPYLERINPDEMLAKKVEELVRRSLADSGKLVFDGKADGNDN